MTRTTENDRIKRGSPTIGDLARAWVERAESAGLSPSTIRGYRTIVERHIAPRMGKVRLLDLSVPMLFDLHTSLEEQTSSDLAIRVLRHLRAILRHAWREGHDVPHFAISLRWAPKRKAPRWQDPDRNHVRTLVGAARSDATRKSPFQQSWLVLFELLLETGARTHELLSIKWRDVDLKKKEICIETRGRHSERLRKLPVTATLSRDLLQLAKAMAPTSADDPVLRAMGRGSAPSYAARREFARLQLRAGITKDLIGKDGKPHNGGLYLLSDLRCVAPSWWRLMGVDCRTVQYLTGRHHNCEWCDNLAFLTPIPMISPDLTAALERDLYQSQKAPS